MGLKRSEAKGHAACVCELNTTLKCRSGIISQSAKRCYQDFSVWGEGKVFAGANQKQICKRQMASGKREMANGKWQEASGDSRVNPHYSI